MQNEKLRRQVLFCILHSAFFICLPGCNVLGAIAGKVVPAPIIPAQYTGFHDQSIAIMVWAGDGTLIDFPDIRSDLAGSLEVKFQQAQAAKAKEFANVTFPTTPSSVVRFQENHPEYEAMPLTDMAPKLNATRVVYIELENLQTRSNASVELFRGSGSATVKVVEVPPKGTGGAAKIGYEESGISAVYPPKAREEGSPEGNDRTIYHGLVDALASEIAKRFVPHQEEQ